jgi:hypothetical protein
MDFFDSIQCGKGQYHDKTDSYMQHQIDELLNKRKQDTIMTDDI